MLLVSDSGKYEGAGAVGWVLAVQLIIGAEKNNLCAQVSCAPIASYFFHRSQLQSVEGTSYLIDVGYVVPFIVCPPALIKDSNNLPVGH